MDSEEKLYYFSISSSNFPSGPSSTSMETTQTCSIPIGSSSFDPFLSPHPIGFSGSPLNLENIGVAQPLECLHGTLVPPFLSKTYELVEDPKLDPIISWAPRGGSFVVWDPVEFARIVLPGNFKHNNFSSFVRQLNTYGFRKIDPDKWEFANELFLRGKKHLLRNIHRRKSSNGSSAETPKSVKGSEIESLRKEKSALMHEVVELQQQQRGTEESMEMVKHMLKASEQRQKQTVSFLAKVVQNPVFVNRLKQMKERNSLGSPRTRRKFLKQKQQESGTAMEGQIVRYRPELGNLGDVPCSEIHVSNTPDSLFQDLVGKLSTGMEIMPFHTEDDPFDDLATTQELLNITSSAIGDPFSSPQPEAVAEYLVSPSEELPKERTIPKFSSPSIENIIKQEDIWSMGYDLSAGMSSSSPVLWGNDACYHVSDMGPLGSLATGSSGIEKWLSDDGSPLG